MIQLEQSLCEEIVKILEDKKAENISIINVSKKSILADFLIVASAQSSRQLYSTAEHIGIALKAKQIIPTVDGKPPCDWVVVDGGSIIVHLFKPEARAYYNIEKMWNLDIKDTNS